MRVISATIKKDEPHKAVVEIDDGTAKTNMLISNEVVQLLCIDFA